MVTIYNIIILKSSKRITTFICYN